MDTEYVEVKCSYCHAAVPGDTKVCPICGANVGESPVSAAKPTVYNKEALKKYTFFVLGEVRKGTDNFTIAQKLAKMGVDLNTASQFVEDIRPGTANVSEVDLAQVPSYARALLGAALAALVGGIVWGLLIIGTNYEFGFVAWGMGWLAGIAVVKFSGGKGVPLQIIAVSSSLFGIVIGKYIAFEHFLEAKILEVYGSDVAANVSIFSEKVVGVFLTNIGLVLNGYDILWVFLAVATAWRIPKE